MPFSIIKNNSNAIYADVLIKPAVDRSSKIRPAGETTHITPRAPFQTRNNIYARDSLIFEIPGYDKKDKSLYKKVKNAYISALNKALLSKPQTICISVFSEETSSYPKSAEYNFVTKAVKHFLRKNNTLIYLWFNQRVNRQIKPKFFGKLNDYLCNYSNFYSYTLDSQLKSRVSESYKSSTKEYYEASKAVGRSQKSIRPQVPNEEAARYKPTSKHLKKKQSQKSISPHVPNEEASSKMCCEESSMPRSPQPILEYFSPMRMIDDYSPSSFFEEADISFSEALFQLIGEKGFKESDVYNNANIDRKHFSKIRKGIIRAPRKSTVLALAIAMKLDLEETNSLLNKAGLSLTNSNKGDLIVKYHIINKIYDIYQINTVLSEYDQYLLGSVD